MDVVILKQANRELALLPEESSSSLWAILRFLKNGETLGPPISKPLNNVYRGLNEIRLSTKFGEYRVFYLIKINEAIYVLHGMVKKKQKIDNKTINLLKTRIRSL